MAGAGFGRAEYSDRNAAAQSFQCRDEIGELPVRVPRHVFTEETSSPAFIEDADDMLGKPAVIVGAEALSGDGIGLAGVSASDAMNMATPASCVEGGKIRPDRRCSQLSRFHARCQDGSGIGFPLHVTDCTACWFGNVEAKVEPADAGAQADEVEGT